MSLLRIFTISVLPILLMISCAQSKKTITSEYKGHGGESLSEETLAKFAPKALAPEVTKKIQSYLDISSTGLGLTSNDGKNFYFSWRVTGTSQVWKVNGPLAFPVQLTGGEDNTNLVGLTPNGKFLLHSRDSRGDEYPGLYYQNSDGGPLVEVYRKKNVQAIICYISDDSRYVYFRANDEDPSTYNIYKYDFITNTIAPVFKGKNGFWTMNDYKNGKILLAYWRGNTESEYFVLDEKTNELRPLIGQNESEEYNIYFGARDNEYIVQTNKLGEFRALFTFKDKKLTQISPKIEADVSEFYLDKKREKIFYMMNNKGYEQVKVLNAKTFTNINLPEFKMKNLIHTYFGSTSRNGRYTTIGVETADAPRRSFVFDWQTKKLIPYTMPSQPEVDTSNFTAPVLDYYTARDGVKIPMFVYRKDRCKKELCPVIINFHGGPEAQAQPMFSPFVELFLEAGFTFVEPNVRGSDGYGKSWLHSDNGAKRLQVIGDIEDAAIYLKKQWSIDGKVPKFGIMGGSYGGYSTLAGMTLFAGTYQAGVAIVGMSSLISFLENTAPYRRALRISEYGDPEKDREALIKLSPLYHLDKIKDPIMVIHGANDPRVPAGEAVQIYEAMEKKKLSGELILFADEGHGISKRGNRVLYIGHAISFFKKTLL
jgi:protease II